jgi:hypothetical protein
MAPTSRPAAGGPAAVSSTAGSMAAVSPPSRAWRTAVAVSVATAIGAIGHLLAGGSLSVGALAVALAAAAVPAWLSSGRECSWARIAALQIGNQQLVHVALSFATAAGIGEPVVAEPMPHDVMPHDRMPHDVVPHDRMPPAHVLAGLITAVVPHDLMLPAHILAGLVTAVALRAGERRLWADVRRIAARLRRRWRRLTDPGHISPPAAALSPAVMPDHNPRPHQRMLRHAVVLRGPPPAAS